MPGLWRNQPATPEGKYLVTRRDGSVPKWPLFVLGARDPAAPAALRAYAAVAAEQGYDPHYVYDLLMLAEEFEQYRLLHGAGSPDAGPEIVDDPDTVKRMGMGKSA